MQPCYIGVSCIAQLETRWLPKFQQTYCDIINQLDIKHWQFTQELDSTNKI